MSCFICGRSNCTPFFHSSEEQSYFEPAEMAYARYLEIRSECEDNWRQSQEEDVEDEN